MHFLIVNIHLTLFLGLKTTPMKNSKDMTHVLNQGFQLDLPVKTPSHNFDEKIWNVDMCPISNFPIRYFIDGVVK